MCFIFLQINLKINVDLFFSFLYFHNRQDIIIQVIIIIVPSPILGVESNIFFKKKYLHMILGGNSHKEVDAPWIYHMRFVIQ